MARRHMPPAFNLAPTSVLVHTQALPMGSTMRASTSSSDGMKPVVVVLAVGAVVALMVYANKRWESYTPEERSDIRKHNRQMTMIGAARDIFD